MSTSKKQKRYVVRSGEKEGIYSSWEECKNQVDGYPGAKYKSFETKQLAEQALLEGSEKYYKKPVKKERIDWKNSDIPFQKNSIAVDAACSGNPGIMEYQGIDLQSGKQIFYQKFDYGTNNIGEFLALVHALVYVQEKKKNDLYIYTDSKIATNWVHLKKCKTLADISEDLQKVITRAEDRLKNNYSNEKAEKILKRKTSEWGEIPADFGRK